MKKFIYPFFTLVILLVTVECSHAQFEGKILYKSYEVNSNGDKVSKDEFTMYVTPDRIMLQGKNEYDFIGSIKTEGVLVRLDVEDFIFLTGNDNALKISKNDITSLMNMFGDSNKEPVGKVDYEQTDKTQEIQGYKCTKFVFTDEENSDDYSEVWMTKAFRINWGMLAESWGSSTGKMLGGSLPFDLIFKDGYFPVKIDTHKEGRLEEITEATEISKSSIAKAMVQIPSGVKVLSFQDYLFQKMSQQ